MRVISCSVFLLILLTGCVTPERPPSTKQDPGEWQGSSVATRGGPGNKSPYTVLGETYNVMSDSLGYIDIGVASWYGRKFHGRLTSNGETYDMFGLTAAHRTLPIPTIVRVTNLDNGRKAIVRVNDRGPFHDDRLIDLSYEVALQLGFADKGTAPVVVEALDELNYPELDLTVSERESYYLQVGAFAQKQGAKRQLDQVRELIEKSMLEDVKVQILQSELENTILHKVWMGPIETPEHVDQLARLVEDANLGIPLRVEVERND